MKAENSLPQFHCELSRKSTSFHSAILIIIDNEVNYQYQCQIVLASLDHSLIFINYQLFIHLNLGIMKLHLETYGKAGSPLKHFLNLISA